MQEKITWQSPEHTHKEKDTNWYIAFLIISLGITVSAILLKNYFLTKLCFIESPATEAKPKKNIN